MQISRDFGAYIKELILYSLNSKMFKTLITATGQRMTTLNRDCHHSVTLDRSRKLREEVGIGRGLPSGLSLDDREPVNSRWFPTLNILAAETGNQGVSLLINTVTPVRKAAILKLFESRFLLTVRKYTVFRVGYQNT